MQVLAPKIRMLIRCPLRRGTDRLDIDAIVVTVVTRHRLLTEIRAAVIGLSRGPCPFAVTVGSTSMPIIAPD